MKPQCDKIKVIHVITRFDKGGSAENTFITVRDLDKARYDVILITGASLQGNLGRKRNPGTRKAKRCGPILPQSVSIKSG
jgi:hypothetical protein